MKNQQLKKINLYLTIYAGVTSLLFIAFIIHSFIPQHQKKLNIDELTVKRMNIIAEDGSVRMVLSNEKRQHPGIINGKQASKRERPSGIIFFNSSGDECGGLVYDGTSEGAGMVLSIDKFKEDQIMQLQYIEDGKKHLRKYGLQLWDYPKEDAYNERAERYKKVLAMKDRKAQSKAIRKMDMDGLLMKDRLFVGKNYKKEVGLFLRDTEGRVRIKIYIDATGKPRMELLDEKGENNLFIQER